MANLFVLRRQVWRRYLRTWVPQMCETPGWASTRLRRLRLGEVPKAIFIEVLGCHLFEAGLRLVPWSLPGDQHWDQLGSNISVCAAGSYPLHKWMTEKSKDVIEWTPNDVDIFISYNSGPVDDDDDEDEVTDTKAAERVYKEIVRRWCDRFEREVLKEDPSTDPARQGIVDPEDSGFSLAEMARDTVEWYGLRHNRGNLPRIELDDRGENQLETAARECAFVITSIRDFAIPHASILNDRVYENKFINPIFRQTAERRLLKKGVLNASGSSSPIPKLLKHYFDAIKLPVFSFILFRDVRPGSVPTLNRVLDTFDIDVCQVGIEGPPPEDEEATTTTPWWTIVDDTGTRLRTRNENVANAINNRTATVIRQYDAVRTLKREQKYKSRGFNFVLTQLPESS